MQEDQKYITVKEFAAKFGVSRERVHQLIREKKIKAVKDYGLWLIPAEQEYKPKRNKGKKGGLKC